MLACRTANLVRSLTRRLCINAIPSGFVGSAHQQGPSLIAVVSPPLPPIQAIAGPMEVPALTGVAHSALEDLSDALDKGNMRLFVQKLKSLPGTKPPTAELVDLLDKAVERICNPRDVADWLYSLGKLGFRCSHYKHRALVLRSVTQLSTAQGLTAINLGMCLDGLLRTDLKLVDLPVDQRTGLWKAIDQTAALLDPRNLANVLKALGKLGATWSSVPIDLQCVLWQALERNAPKMLADGYHTALLVHALGQLGLNSSSLSEKQYELLVKVAMRGISGQGASQVNQQNTMVIMGLAKMKINYTNLPEEARAHMESCLVSTLPSMDAMGVSSVIYAFGLMHCSWPALSSALQHAFQHASVSRLPAMVNQNVFMTLNGFANMDTLWTQLMPEMQQATEQAVIAMAHSSRSQSKDAEQPVANAIYCLGKMSVPWSALSTEFHAAIVETVILLQDKLLPQSLCNFVSGLGGMGAPVQDMGPAFKIAVEKTLHRLHGLESSDSFRQQEISTMLMGFAQMGASWSQLPAKMDIERFLVKLAPKMTARSVASAVYALGMMKVSCQGLRKGTLQAIAVAVDTTAPTMLPAAVGMCMYGLTLMCFDFQATSKGSPVEKEKEQHMRTMINAIIKRFQSLSPEERKDQDARQVAIFFAWLSVVPGGKKLITKELGSRPTFSAFAADAPTAAHLALSQALSQALNALQQEDLPQDQQQPAGQQFQLTNGFDGLGNRLLPMDIAVHQNNGKKLIAFVEVGGRDQHSMSGKVQRIGQLKEFLYAKRFPGVPVYREGMHPVVMGEEPEASAKWLAERILKKGDSGIGGSDGGVSGVAAVVTP